MLLDKQIAVFATAREVIKADTACRNNRLDTKVISVPEHISSECGMCLEVPVSQITTFLSLMDSLSLKTKLYD